MHRLVLLSVFLYYLKECPRVETSRSKRQAQVESVIETNIPLELLNLGSLRNIAQRIITKGKDLVQNGRKFDVTIEYSPTGQQAELGHSQEFPPQSGGRPPQLTGPPPQFGGPPPPFGGPPAQFGGHLTHPGGPPPRFEGGPPHPRRPPHPRGPPSEFGGFPPEFGGPPPEFGGLPPGFGGPPRRFKDRRPGWLVPSDFPGFKVTEGSSGPPPGQFKPHRQGYHSSRGHHGNGNEGQRRDFGSKTEGHSQGKNRGDESQISGYFDGNFPVILLDSENEVRR